MTRIETTLTREFLDGKVNAYLDLLVRTGRAVMPSVIYIECPTQTAETESGRLYGVVHNLLGEWDGHYEFIVDPVTFDYEVRQHGYYGTFTRMSEPRDMRIYRKPDMTPDQITVIEGILAHAVIKSSQYTGNCECPIGVISKRTQQQAFGRIHPDNL